MCELINSAVTGIYYSVGGPFPGVIKNGNPIGIWYASSGPFGGVIERWNDPRNVFVDSSGQIHRWGSPLGRITPEGGLYHGESKVGDLVCGKCNKQEMFEHGTAILFYLLASSGKL